MSNNSIPLSKIISVLSGDEDIMGKPNVNNTNLDGKSKLSGKIDSKLLAKSKLSKVKKSHNKKDVN
tara:strand:+ start:1850 stop:2047 length:198 start_codon:yes stop_codon:yes gene_type:complete